jgi:hypothetical protein
MSNTSITKTTPLHIKHLFSSGSGCGERYCDLCNRWVKPEDAEECCKPDVPDRRNSNEADYNYNERMAIYDKLEELKYWGNPTKS